MACRSQANSMLVAVGLQGSAPSAQSDLRIACETHHFLLADLQLRSIRYLTSTTHSSQSIDRLLLLPFWKTKPGAPCAAERCQRFSRTNPKEVSESRRLRQSIEPFLSARKAFCEVGWRVHLVERDQRLSQLFAPLICQCSTAQYLAFSRCE